MGDKKSGNIGEVVVASDLLMVVNDAIQAAAKVIKEGKLKDLKVPELLKLIQLQKELGGDRPKDINVRWIETWESKNSNDE